MMTLGSKYSMQYRFHASFLDLTETGEHNIICESVELYRQAQAGRDARMQAVEHRQAVDAHQDAGRQHVVDDGLRADCSALTPSIVAESAALHEQLLFLLLHWVVIGWGVQPSQRRLRTHVVLLARSARRRRNADPGTAAGAQIEHRKMQCGRPGMTRHGNRTNGEVCICL